MKSKKGFELLGEHTIGVIIAVICLLALFYLGAKLFGFFNDQQNLEKATTYLDQISSGVAGLKNVGDSKELIILSPTEWYVSVWPNSDKEYPPSCNHLPCICISKKAPTTDKNFNWDSASIATCKVSDNLQFNMKTNYFYRLFCSGNVQPYYQIKPTLALRITLKPENLVYLEEVC